jgi:hypothetical protein
VDPDATITTRIERDSNVSILVQRMGMTAC